MLIIQARQYDASSNHWSLGFSTYGSHAADQTKGGHGGVTGDPQQVFILPANAPSITVQPQSRTAGVGTDVSFTGLVGGTSPFSYQWQFNGTNLPGATNLTLVLTSVQLEDAGVYTLRVSNAAGAATASASLVVGRVWLDGLSQADDALQFSLHSPAGKACVIEASTNLVDWMTSVTITNVTGTVSLTNAMTGFRSRFFRARLTQ